jgi:hypothetical protein
VHENAEARPEEEVLQQIVGEKLSSVEFVQDYVQLRFDGPTLTAITQPVVGVGSRSFGWNEPGYRDELCDLIGRTVVSARIRAGESLHVQFDGDAEVKISLRLEDYRAAEAVHFQADPASWFAI